MAKEDEDANAGSSKMRTLLVARWYEAANENPDLNNLFVSNQKLAHAYVPDEYPVLPVVAIRHDAANKNPYVNSINNNNIIQCQQSLHAHKPGF